MELSSVLEDKYRIGQATVVIEEAVEVSVILEITFQKIKLLDSWFNNDVECLEHKHISAFLTIWGFWYNIM